jgi:hypothetical protein
MDWETHRILTRGGRFRALVFTLKHSVVMREPLGLYAARVTTFSSMAELKKLIRKRGWRVKEVRHFS